MRAEDFTEKMAGRLVATPQGYLAFIPHVLPPNLDLSWGLVRQVTAAERALSQLAGLARVLPNPYLLIGLFVRREAVLSSRIEGTMASLSDLFYFEAASDPPSEAPDVQEVANYVRALEHGLARLKELPVSLRLIREMHEKLMSRVGGDHLTPGEFRRSQNWIGPGGCTLMNATYVPPPIQEMQTALDQFEKYLHAESEMPLLIRLSLIHYQFEAIHPFLDGNGRIGRLLLTLILSDQGILPQPMLYLSAFFERYRDDYYRLLLGVSRRGEWMDWILYFLRGVEQQSRDALVRAERLLELWQSYRGKVQSTRASASQLTLIDSLFANPVITYAMAAKLLKVTPRAAILNVNKLVETGIIREVTGRQRKQVFLAPEIISILEAKEI